MTDFDHILNWRLKKGSHKFPGPDGGTCINEAAIVAAGFEYRRVHSAFECPPCFSRVISSYAIGLNDSMPDELRQELLMPFVLRLADTMKTDEIEIRRAQLIVLRTVQRILPIQLRANGLEKLARICEKVHNFTAISSAINNKISPLSLSVIAPINTAVVFAIQATNEINEIVPLTHIAVAHAADSARAAAHSLPCNDDFPDCVKIFKIAVKILDEIINIGKSKPLDITIANERMKAIKNTAEMVGER